MMGIQPQACDIHSRLRQTTHLIVASWRECAVGRFSSEWFGRRGGRVSSIAGQARVHMIDPPEDAAGEISNIAETSRAQVIAHGGRANP